MCYHKITAIKSLNFALLDLTQVASLVVKIARKRKKYFENPPYQARRKTTQAS
ncbi:hypothetical protein [Helicobacter sp. MIT 01-3238]|uniref:hypothetical protein n=1 Tax=Helicobacter sp. MIT 01-3238 TaxID=398627 RepID=UPI0015F1B9B7|nr:hypothetical protein [Helicobacter sp. MIT 01-3238]